MVAVPSSYFIRRLANFLRTDEERINWIGLDAGCGPHVGVLATYGLDASPVGGFVNPEYPRERFYQANIYDMPFEDKHFDLVVSAHVIEHLEEPLKAVTEMVRISKYMVIANIPRYTIKLEEVTPCVKLDHYYLSEHPELLEDLKVKEEDLIWVPGATCFYGTFDAPHCAWYPNPEDGVELFKKTGCFEKIEGEVCPDNCGELNVFGYLQQDPDG